MGIEGLRWGHGGHGGQIALLRMEYFREFALITLVLSWLATYAAMRGGLTLIRMRCILCQIAETLEESKSKTKLLPIVAVH